MSETRELPNITLTTGEWHTMDSAPVDTHVECGGWSVLFGKADWRTSSGIAKETRRTLFGRRVKLAYHGEQYTHWRPLPPPPAITERTEA